MSVIDEVFAKVDRQQLRKELKLSKQTMSDWRRFGYVPARHAVAVEQATGIPRERLCPGFEWGRDEKSVAPAANESQSKAASAHT